MAKNTVYFGTNRLIVDEAKGEIGDRYHADRPYYFRIGEVEVEKTGDSWRNADKAYKAGTPKVYPERPGDGDQAAVLGSETLFRKLHQTMKDEERDVLVFIHGFANTFESAMERAAELRDQYLSPKTDAETGTLAKRGREPIVFAFSWPSDGVVLGFASGAAGDDRRKWAYSSDREDARASGAAMARCAVRMFKYLSELQAEDLCRQRIHLVAHSMGTWALRHAVQELKQISADAGVPLGRLFDNAFLMASDINDDALEEEAWLAPLLRLSRRVHVYHAANDSALSLSDIKPNHDARLGHHGPANMNRLNERVSAVDCENVSWTPTLTHVRHQYYRIAPEVVRDVREVLAAKPADEMTQRVSLGGGRYRITHDKKKRKALREK